MVERGKPGEMEDSGEDVEKNMVNKCQKPWRIKSEDDWKAFNSGRHCTAVQSLYEVGNSK